MEIEEGVTMRITSLELESLVNDSFGVSARVSI